MIQVKANEMMRKLFGPLKERTEVVDEGGKLIGYFIPPSNPTEELRQRAFAEYDPEKARRRRESPEGGFTTEQVQAHLKSLGNS